jgi:hypothetical protein
LGLGLADVTAGGVFMGFLKFERRALFPSQAARQKTTAVDLVISTIVDLCLGPLPCASLGAQNQSNHV